MTGQHDDHCWITAFNLPWHIVAVRGSVMELVCPSGCHTTAADMTGADFTAYCELSAMQLAAEIASEERGSTLHAGSEARN